MKKLLIGLREGLLDEFPVLLSLVRRRKVGSLWNAISYDAGLLTLLYEISNTLVLSKQR